jgi:hypothetical protein
MSSVEAEAGASHATDAASRPSLRLVMTPSEPTERAWVPSEEEPRELKLGSRQLELIYRSLEAVRTLGLVERHDELLTDTLELVDAVLQGSGMSMGAQRSRRRDAPGLAEGLRSP